MANEIRAMMRCGRADKDGRAFKASHNDRTFVAPNDPHIDITRSHLNYYIKMSVSGDVIKSATSFVEHERQFYEELFGPHLEYQNEKHRQSWHYYRIRSIDDLLYDKKYKSLPEEEILQIGNMENWQNGDITIEQVKAAMNMYVHNFHRMYGTRVHIMDFALHLDESTPHLHLKVCYSKVNAKSGFLQASERGALKELGIERPHPEQEESRYNNSKITFTSTLRSMWHTCIEQQGIHLNTEAREASKSGMDKEEYVVQKLRAEREVLISQRNELVQETQKLVVEREQLHQEVEVLREEKTRLQRITERLKTSCMTLFERLARVVCADGRCALEHVKNEAQAVLDAQDELTRDEIDTDER